MADVFVYGEIGPDNIIRVPYFPDPGKDAPVLEDSYEMGGAGTNVAVFLANWEVAVGLSGNMLGDDRRGQMVRTWLEAFPTLDPTYLITQPGMHTPFCRILVRPDGERAILFYHADTATMVPPSIEMLKGIKVIAIDLNGGDERVEMARIARQAGVITVLTDVMQLDHPVLAFSDVILNSMALLQHYFPGCDLMEHSRKLHRLSGAIIVTTDGPQSIFIIDRNGKECWIQPPEVTPVDTTGAGDALRAGVIYRLLKGWKLADCIRWGTAAAVINIQRLGATSHPPDLAEIEQLFPSIGQPTGEEA